MGKKADAADQARYDEKRKQELEAAAKPKARKCQHPMLARTEQAETLSPRNMTVSERCRRCGQTRHTLLRWSKTKGRWDVVDMVDWK